ncbi:MAG: hypothetical protein P4M00_00400 [Azospirillaceae bacterium]|nr:hypothetical protein [Azospirillaceae bacterium]
MKSLDRKLANIRAGRYTPQDFIIADAKDADMAFGLMAPGPARDDKGSQLDAVAPRDAYLGAMRAMTQSGLIDILLASASSIEILAQDRLFDNSAVTPAARFNDTSDIWAPRGGRYGQEPSQPFRSARLEALHPLVNLGLYSLTFSNDLTLDLRSLEAYSLFRAQAAALELRHFLEVFNPAFDIGLQGDDIGPFIADSITRCLAGVLAAEHPLFLKLAYNGRAAMEQLASYDPARLVVGILGGAKGTTRDTFELLHQAERAGARVALFGRKINYAEDPLTLVGLMRRVIAAEVTTVDAVRLYHEALSGQGIRPIRSLADDLEFSDALLKQEGA